LPAGETPKTEAWVVLEAGTESRIYAGLKPGTTAASLRHALTKGTVADQLASLTPKPGDAIFLRAGTVHSLGGDVVVFEIQQNSDVTFRLYDWDHVDPKTGKPRALQVDKAIACVDFSEGPVGRVTPVVETKTPVERERLFHCEHFWLWRLRGQSPFTVGAADLRAYWCASREQGRSNTGAPLTPSERATYSSCLRRSERVFFGPSGQ
jgi:mannose-6-phosphate isomerase